MDMKRLILDTKAKLAGILRTRRLQVKMFSGTPLILKIEKVDAHASPALMLHYKNGLLLTLGDAGILDFEDHDFTSFVDNRSFSSREILTMLHKIVLKSLLKFMTHPRMDAEQRERAAEAVSKLWLAWSEGKAPWPSAPEKFMVHS